MLPSASWSMALMVALHAIICRVAGLIASPSSRWQRPGQAGWLSGNASCGTVSARAASAFRVSAGTSSGSRDPVMAPVPAWMMTW
jgi:hypothetical protein